jgi:hypothetical protein
VNEHEGFELLLHPVFVDLEFILLDVGSEQACVVPDHDVLGDDVEPADNPLLPLDGFLLRRRLLRLR